MSKKKLPNIERKWGAIIAVGLLLVLGLVVFLTRSNVKNDVPGVYHGEMGVVQVEEGSIASSTLLTGTVKVAAEEKVYFDSSKGSRISAVYVNVGDYVYQGQALMQYDTSLAQADYDQAVRARDKVGRQIDDLIATGVEVTTDEEGNEYITEQAQRTYDSQLQEFYDAYADAQANIDKTYALLENTWITSSISGRVVSIDTNVAPSQTGAHLVMHIVSDSELEVEGSLTEMDISSVSVGQPVKLTSKVYPDKSWEGLVAYISHYPSENTNSTGNNTAAAYPFKVNIGGDTSDLRQGFKMSIEVQSREKSLLVPVEAIVAEGETAYVWVYDKSSSTVSKQEVTVGKADAINQEISSGLKKGQSVLVYPRYDLTEGQKIDGDQLLEMTDLEGGNG